VAHDRPGARAPQTLAYACSGEHPHGVPFDAKRAYDIGAVAAVTSAEHLEAEVQRWIDLSTRSEVLARGRRSAHKLLSLPYLDALDASYEEFTALFSKRQPN